MGFTQENESENESKKSSSSSGESTTSRRDALRSIGAMGVIPAASRVSSLEIPFFSAKRKESLTPTDLVYSSAEVDQLKSKFPELDISPQNVQRTTTDADGNTTSVTISVPVGTLKYINISDSSQVILVLDSGARNQIDNWASGTEGQIRATASEAQFIRTTTDEEKRDILLELGATEMKRVTSTSVLIAPGNNTYFIDKLDSKAREIESIVATSAQSDALTMSTASSGIEIIEQNYYGDSISFGVADAENCHIDNTLGTDIFFCLTQVVSCSLCAPSLVGGPPAAVACLLVVCLGSVTALEAVLPQLENGCYNLGERALTCYVEWTEGIRFQCCGT